MSNLKCLYLIGSLRNKEIGPLGVRLRQVLNIEIFNDWHAAGPEADDYWQAHERERGRTYEEALGGYHALDIFDFDRLHLNRSDGGILVLPSGRSCHLEAGYLVGQDKPLFILLTEEPDRYDIMYNFASKVCRNEKELIGAVSGHQ